METVWQDLRYALLHYSVIQRSQEIGIRMALGARASDVLRMIIAEGLSLALIGIGVGLVAALWLTQTVSRLLYEVTPTDPIAFALAPAILIAVALLACLLPARRASRVDPRVALHYE